MNIAVDGSGSIFYNKGHANIVKHDVNGDSINYVLVYFGLTYNSEQNMMSLYKNGEILTSFQIASLSFSKKDVIIGNCENACNPYDFGGYLYAFKWAKIHRDAEYFKEIWLKGKSWFIVIYLQSITAIKNHK